MAEPPFEGARLVAGPEAVVAAWERLAAGIQPHVEQGPCVLLGVMLGGIVALVNVAARLRGDFVIDYCHVTRYEGGIEGGAVRWIQRPRADLVGRTVVVVDDVFDEGRTLEELYDYCTAQGARRIVLAVLVRKRHARAVGTVGPDLVGLEAGEEYLFGCGMDFHDRWRHLDAIWAVGARTSR